MGRVWLVAATLAHTECALLLSKIDSYLEKKQPNVVMMVDVCYVPNFDLGSCRSFLRRVNCDRIYVLT